MEYTKLTLAGKTAGVNGELLGMGKENQILATEIAVGEHTCCSGYSKLHIVGLGMF